MAEEIIRPIIPFINFLSKAEGTVLSEGLESDGFWEPLLGDCDRVVCACCIINIHSHCYPHFVFDDSDMGIRLGF